MMLKRTALFLFLVIIISCGMGCLGGNNSSSNSRIILSGSAFLGGEPATALPNPGILSFAPHFATRKQALVNQNLPAKPTSLIVTCDPSLSQVAQQQSLQELGYKIIRQLYSDTNTYEVKPINITNLEVSYRSLLNAGFVRAVEYNFPVTKMADPGEILYNQRQWDMMVTKFNVAWDNYKGQNPVVVAVLDTGINVNSDELINRMVPATDWYDFTEDDNDPREPTIFDSGAKVYSHGTNVAGIIGAKPGNNIGYAGAAWDETKIKIMPVRVLNTFNQGYISDITDGVRWAVDHGAKVINLSLGASADTNSALLNAAVAYARDHNVTLVCAAGNENTTVDYPARLASSYPNVIAVGATGYTNCKAWYSCYGPELSVMAPGGDPDVSISANQQYIWNITFIKTIPQGEVYDYGFYGTSQATPHVSALAAMLYSYGVTEPERIRNIIMNTATDLGANGRDNLYGYGLINAFAAMISATTDVSLVTLGIRDPNTKTDVGAIVHPNSAGQFKFSLAPGNYELYGYYNLPNGYKYEGATPVSISFTNPFFPIVTKKILLTLLPD